jgi:secreted PhoX family phosphatase
MSQIDQYSNDEPIHSTEGHGETFEAIVERRLSRRAFLKAVATSAVVVGAGMGGTISTASAQEGKFALSFKPIEPSAGPDPLLAEGYSEQVLISWGDPPKS